MLTDTLLADTVFATSVFAAIEALAPIAALRGSTWVYPLVNAAHVLGIALLVGAIVTLDLRLLGAWRSAALAPLWRVLRPVAACGLALAAASGLLLFATRAGQYAASPYFLAKLVIVALGILNALALHHRLDLHRARQAQAQGTGQHWPDVEASHAIRLPAHVRAAAALSLACWLAALLLGRLVGYF